MAVKANQQYYADWEYIDKQAREFQPTSEFKNKIDSIEEWAQVNVIEDIKVNWESVAVEDKTVELTIPIVIDNLYTVDWVNALSAKQGKILYDLVQNLQARGRYLSNWNTATWLPVTIPESSPYQYKPWDYFVVSAVAEEGWTNYRPNGSEFIVWQASTTVETNTVNVTDLYLYDGTNWNLLINSAREIPIDPSLSTTSTNPVENRVVTNAINNKQDKLIAWTNIQIDNDWKTISATDTTYTAWANINIDANNEISAVDTTYTAWANVQISNENVISATDTTYTAWTGIDITNWVITNTQTSAERWNITWTLSDQTDLQSALDNKQDKFHTISATAPSNPSEWDEWYDSTNDILMVYDWTDWKEAWTQMKILSYGYSTWQDFIDAYNGNAIVYCRASSNQNPATWTQWRMAFMAFVNNADNPTEVEFQYYRSRNNHDSAANQVDEVYVYKLVPANGWTWTVTQRNTAAKLVAWSNVSITWWSWNAVINATGTAYTAWDGIDIANDEISVDVTDIIWTWLSEDANNNIIVDTTTIQPKLTAWTNIAIDANNEISATDTTYTAWNWISIDTNNEISVDTDIIQEKLTAWDGITIENVCTDISDMQWPAPDGFHVPLNTEWQAMYDIWTALGGWSSDWINFWIALKLPLAGDRFRWSSSVSDQGAYGRYRSSTRTNASNAYSIHFDSSVISPQTASQRSNGLSVRCFKNSPIVPTPSWAKLYWMSIESWWIFWSSTDWLISLSSNWQTWVTIMDKNLWATTVWNSGDTLSEANCGKYYQRWNNYGFPRTWTVTASSTQVDASAYWPWNYYSSSTFITRSSSPYRWDTTDNANLRWWVSQWSSQECALTISADTTVLATKTDLNSKQDTLVSGTNIKTINNESLLWSGNITISAPTYIAWDWISIDANNEISVDTDVIQEKLTAWTGIAITGWTVCITESDRKWPAPSWFHVPSWLEWWDILNWLQLLWLGGCENAMTYLKLPMAGYREYDTTYLDNRWTVWCYWSSTPNDSTTAYILSFDGTNISSGNSITRSAWLPIRAFKNTIALPDNTWTVLSWTLWSWWVFWNQTEWLITVTWDWTTGYTIMDKNLWATQVWNYWDAEWQEETCGQTYQWWNNYWFTWDDNLVILDPSHTKRDVTGYWPTNYYSNSYWVAESPWQNSTSNGNDLWWNVSNSTHQECTTSPLTISSTIEQWIISSNDTYEDVVHLTQEEYDALETKDPNTLYSTPDSWSWGWGSKWGVIWEVISFAWITVPEDFLECDWSALSTSAYADLFAVIGYSYWWSGWTFNLPNLKGRVITWYDSSDSCFNSTWKCWWEKTHKLTINEMPRHFHDYYYAYNSWSWTSADWSNAWTCANLNTSSAWWDQAHNNLQPYLTMKYIIRYQ